MKTNITGSVLDTNGKPLTGSTRISLQTEGDKHPIDVDVGADGRFSASGFDSDNDYELTVYRDEIEIMSFPVFLEDREEHGINITVRPNGGTTMTTTTTGSTTTGTTTTGTTTTGTTTTGTTTTGTATTGSTTTGTTTTASTATTMTVPGSTITVPQPGNGSLRRLLDAVGGIDLHPPVNVEEAEEFRRLYIVANYTAAGLPGSIAALNAALTSESDSGPTMVNKAGLLADQGDRIDAILDKVAEDHNGRQMLMREARAQFDLGSEPAETVNAEFKDVFRQFVDQCSDELMAFDLDEATNNPLMTPERIEEGINFLRRTKRSLIDVMESMSRAGRLGTDRLIRKWADITADSVIVIKKVGKDHIATDDNDQKHEWSVVANLNDRARSDIEPYLVHAKEGADNLDTVIKAYNKVRAADKLANEDQIYLQQLFNDKAYLSFPDPDIPGGTLTLSERLRKGATLIQENWIAEWN